MPELLLDVGFNAKQNELYQKLSTLEKLADCDVVRGTYRPPARTTTIPGVDNDEPNQSRVFVEAKVPSELYSSAAISEYLTNNGFSEFRVDSGYDEHKTFYWRAIFVKWDCGKSTSRVSGNEQKIDHEFVLAVKKSE